MPVSQKAGVPDKPAGGLLGWELRTLLTAADMGHRQEQSKDMGRQPAGGQRLRICHIPSPQVRLTF
jgi:hypothetical protein